MIVICLWFCMPAFSQELSNQHAGRLLVDHKFTVDLPVRVTVEDTSSNGTNRTQEPVTSGIPLPKNAAVKNVQSLILMDEQDREVPVQFRVLSRWHGPADDEALPIRWVLTDFQADVPAGGSRSYRLDTGLHTQQIHDGISIKEQENFLTIDTGAARFVLNKHYFNLFDKVWTQNGSLLVDQQGKGGVLLVDDQGKRFTSLNSPPEIFEVEEHGPLRSVVRIRGVLSSDEGLYFAPAVNNSDEWPRFSQPYEHSFFYYECRIHFYAKKNYVRIFMTLENNGANGRTNPEQYFAPPQPAYFDKVHLDLNLVQQSQMTARFNTTEETLTDSSNFTLLQNWQEATKNTRNGTLVPSFKEGAFYTLHKNGQLFDKGHIHPGWFYLKGNQGRISMGIRHFWQNFPKKITATPSLLSIGLWPEEGYYPYCNSNDFPDDKYSLYCHKAGQDAGIYLFDAGRHKTHEILLAFNDPGDDDTALQLKGFLEEPLMAVAPPEWYADTGALGLIAPDTQQMMGISENREALRRFDLFQLAMVDEEVSENQWTIHTLKTNSPPINRFNKQYRYFGWMGFGDLLWSGQSACALHYDWPYSMLLHYLRTGHRKFFDTAVEMVKHRYDIDQYHGSRKDSKGNHVWTNHMAFYESDRHSDPSINTYKPAQVGKNSHTWNGGLVLYYLLTGDTRAWDSAMENGQAAFNRLYKRAETPSCADSETRQETWPMLNLINLYRVNGDAAYLQLAKNIAKNRLMYREQQAGGRGNFGSGSDCDAIKGNRQASTMYAYAVDPILQVHHETRDEELAALIVRMADFSKDLFLFGGDTNEEGKYRPLQSLYVWKENDPEGVAAGKKGEPVKNLFWADLFAYAYRLTGDGKYLELARQTFRDAMFYYAAHGSKYINPSYRSKISFIDNMFSNSETKVHGWIGRTNQVYLNTEYLILQNKIHSVLTETSPNYTISAGNDARVYGTDSSNHIVVESGAKAELINFPGQNIIQIQADSSFFTIARSGTVVSFTGSDGTFLKIPATTDEQVIVFFDKTLVLQINNNQVFLGDQKI